MYDYSKYLKINDNILYNYIKVIYKDGGIQ